MQILSFFSKFGMVNIRILRVILYTLIRYIANLFEKPLFFGEKNGKTAENFSFFCVFRYEAHAQQGGKLQIWIQRSQKRRTGEKKNFCFFLETAFLNLGLLNQYTELL